ncbi:MAG TPA: LemA family protein [Clostridia bacterium]|jgi:LemA protein|nr:LemA family protein [Clostridia bacterium]HQM96374.1 LemA family protein [Clostridia bacterium]HQO69810.1 LemA family protein [Clostridia bacterium]
MPTVIAILSIIFVIAIWVISIQRKIEVLDENAGNAMRQIGVQLSGRIDSLTVLVDYIRNNYVFSISIVEEALSRRRVITAKSVPEDVLYQENIINDVLVKISVFIESYPDIKTEQKYISCMDAEQTFNNMIHTSCLIYNDSVAKLNHEVTVFPSSIAAKLLGYKPREYLVNKSDSVDIKQENLSS